MTDGRRRAAVFGSWAAVSLVYLFLYAPVFTIAAFSVNDSALQTLPWAGFTSGWYRSMIDNPAIIDAIGTSLVVSGGAVLVGLIVGTYFAVLLHHRLSGSIAAIVEGVLMIPVLLPGIVLGLALAIWFGEFLPVSGIPRVILGHATFVTPLIMIIVLTRLRSIDPTYEQASMDLGANRWRTFWNVTLPDLRTALFGAGLLGFTLSFDEIIVTFFLADGATTLPVHVWNQTRFGFTPEINAVFTVIGGISLAGILAAAVVLKSDFRRAIGGSSSA